MKQKKGFTLIELLVVIAIIALLLSVILPSLKIAKDRAMEILCENNMRQFGIGMNLYCEDNEAQFPNSEDWFFIGLVNGRWTAPPNFNCVWHDASLIPNGLIVNYLSGDEVRVCPAFKKIAVTRSRCAQGIAHDAAIPIDPQFNYSQNPFLGRMETRPNIDHVIKITQVRSPSMVFSFGEENPYVIQAGDRPLYGNFTVSVSTNTPMNDCILFTLEPGTVKGRIGTGSKYDIQPTFVDSFGSFHRAKDADGLLGYSKAVFVDGHIQNVQPEESLIYAWPF